MSPILVRPVREQLEHDRVIRLLQAKYKRKFDVGINPGNEQSVPVGAGMSPWYPDLVLHSTERSRKLLGVVEVETVESINHLEAMSQWAAFARLKAPFHLYVPAAMVDVARRFCSDLHIQVTEIWAYHAIGDQIRFTAIQRMPGSDDGAPAGREPRRPKSLASPTAKTPTAKTPKPKAVKTAVKSASKTSASKPSRRAAPVAAKKNGRPSGTKSPAAKGSAKSASKKAASKRK